MKNISKIVGGLLLIIGLLCLTAEKSMATIIDFGGGNVTFDLGDALTATTFSFSDSAVTSGLLSGANVTIGGTHTIGGLLSPNRYAVTGSGVFTLSTLLGSLTGNLVMVDIGQFGSVGGTNILASANLTGLSVTGTDATINSLFSSSTGGMLNTSFQFAPVSSVPDLSILADVTATGGGSPFSTSYSGSANIPAPEPGSLFLLGSGLIGLAIWGRKRIALD